MPPQGGHAVSRPFQMWPRMAEGDAPREKSFSALGLSLLLESGEFLVLCPGLWKIWDVKRSKVPNLGVL